ncbi:MAG: hypothetical protein FJ267_11640, partial [Planctomycetes bacterium]|nr:hypothetical protein [Planctomycetota bacterium]
MVPRSQYQSDGKWDWSRLAIVVCVGIGTALFTALLLTFIADQYGAIPPLLPIFVSVPLAWLMSYLVGWGRIRNRVFAAGIAAVISGVGYLSFQFLLLNGDGFSFSYRFDRIVEAVSNRMRIERLTTEMPERLTIEKLFVFSLELASIVAIAGATSWIRASRAFSPERNSWYRRRQLQLPGYTGRDLLTALEEGKLASFVANC